MVDEGDDSTGALSAVSADGRISRESRHTRVWTQLRFLHACDQHIVSIQKVVEFSRRPLDTITVPSQKTLRGRRRRTTTRARVRVNPGDEEEND